jgi:hypothetical protein
VSVQGCRPAPFRNNRHKVGDLASRWHEPSNT